MPGVVVPVRVALVEKRISTFFCLVRHVGEASGLAREDLLADEAVDPEFGTGLLLNRFDQFVLESRTIVPAAGDALLAGDLERFGSLVDRSQQAVEEWLGTF